VDAIVEAIEEAVAVAVDVQLGDRPLAVQQQREAEQHLDVVRPTIVDQVPGGHVVADVEAEGQQAVDVELHAAAEVQGGVDVAAEATAGAGHHAEADEGEGRDAIRELQQAVSAERAEQRVGAVVTELGGHHPALDLEAEEGQGVVAEAQADVGGDLLVGLPGVVDVVQLVLRIGEQDTAVDAALELMRGRPMALDPRLGALVVGAGIVGLWTGVDLAADRGVRELNAAAAGRRISGRRPVRRGVGDRDRGRLQGAGGARGGEEREG
jgi:hypothetical protein